METFHTEEFAALSANFLRAPPGMLWSGGAARGCIPSTMPARDICRSPIRSLSKRPLRGADAVVLVAEWPEFRELGQVWAGSLMKAPFVIDGRNSYDSAAGRAASSEHKGLGRP